MTSGGLAHERRLEADDCVAVASAAALIMALAVEGMLPPPVAAGTTSATGHARGAGSARRARGSARVGGAVGARGSWCRRVRWRTRRRCRRSRSVRTSASGWSGAHRALRLGVSAHGAFFPSRFGGVDDSGGRFDLLEGALRGCAGYTWKSVEIGPCLGLGVDHMSGSGRGSSVSLTGSGSWGIRSGGPRWRRGRSPAGWPSRGWSARRDSLRAAHLRGRFARVWHHSGDQHRGAPAGSRLRAPRNRPSATLFFDGSGSRPSLPSDQDARSSCAGGPRTSAPAGRGGVGRPAPDVRRGLRVVVRLRLAQRAAARRAGGHGRRRGAGRVRHRPPHPRRVRGALVAQRLALRDHPQRGPRAPAHLAEPSPARAARRGAGGPRSARGQRAGPARERGAGRRRRGWWTACSSRSTTRSARCSSSPSWKNVRHRRSESPSGSHSTPCTRGYVSPGKRSPPPPPVTAREPKERPDERSEPPRRGVARAGA